MGFAFRARDEGWSPQVEHKCRDMTAERQERVRRAILLDLLALLGASTGFVGFAS